MTGASLRVRGPHRFQHDRFRYGLGTTLHRAGRVDADQHRPGFHAPVWPALRAGSGDGHPLVNDLVHALVVLVSEEAALCMVRVPDEAKVPVGQQHGLRRQHARDAAGTVDATCFPGHLWNAGEPKAGMRRSGLFLRRQLDLIRLVCILGRLRAAKVPEQGRHLRQGLDKAPNAHDLLPFVTLEQTAQLVPVRVLEQPPRRSEDLHQLFQQPAALLPIFDKCGDGPGPCGVPGIAAVDIIDDPIEMPEHRAQHLVSEVAALATRVRQIQLQECRVQCSGQRRIGPMHTCRIWGTAREQCLAQALQRAQPGLERSLRVDQAPQPEAARQALER